MIDMIDRSAEQASEIFDDFLDFIKDIPVQKKPVDVNKIIANAVEQISCDNRLENIRIKVNIDENIVLLGDESKLRRVITNLINNAADVLYDNKIENAAIDIASGIKGNILSLTISDNGPGIPKEILSTLFEPFVTKNKSNGTGLGLAIVKQYVNAHGGEISVTNNNGAIFTITFPL